MWLCEGVQVMSGCAIYLYLVLVQLYIYNSYDAIPKS